MRSEKEIREKIREIEKERKWIDKGLWSKGYDSGFITALRWVLEEDEI